IAGARWRRPDEGGRPRGGRVPTLSIGEWPLDGSWFPPFDPVREAGARTDSPPFTPMCSSPPSVAMRLGIATQTMDNLSWITNRRGDSQGASPVRIRSPAASNQWLTPISPASAQVSVHFGHDQRRKAERRIECFATVSGFRNHQADQRNIGTPVHHAVHGD